MIPRIPILFLLALMGACGHAPDREQGGEGRLYSYVDAQGNLVTVERDPGEETGSADGDDAGGESAPGKESWQSTEEVEERIEQEQRDRFISYRGPEGEIITRPLDLVAEREARERRPADYEAVDPGKAYIETFSRVPADCCQQGLDQAPVLEPGDERRLRFGDGVSGWVRLDQPRPAVVLALAPGLGRLTVRSFVHKDAFLSPRLLLLDDQGLPLLKVDNIFSRRYPESWHRFGFFQGELPLEPDAAFAVFYLPYGVREGETLVAESGLSGVMEDGARPALEGELVVRGSAAD